MPTLRVGYRGVSDRVIERADSIPDFIAVRFRDQTLDYRELNLGADKFAAYLAERGIVAGDSVAICLERSFDWIIAALGIMRAGGAYVPLDSAWPDSRLRFALGDSGSKILVAPTMRLDRLDGSWQGVDPLRDAAVIAATRRFDAPVIEPESVAYVIYTSGSTGVPKGVEITHANLNHLIEWHLGAFGVTQSDRASHLAGLGFDAAVWEIWPHLSIGASICLADDSVRSSPELIQQWMIEERVTIGFVPTVHAAPMMAMQWPATTELRFLLTGGDTLQSGPSVDQPFKVVNNYGPTECTVVATSSVLRVGSPGAPPIGRPIAGADVYLLDDNGDRVADGDLGEIYIGGRGVGRGYRNLPDATKRSFLPDPFVSSPGAIMYRTGDRGIRLPDGEIEFRGRLDRQAKIRGYRIELDEIGNVLGQYSTVDFAVVTVDTPEAGESQLVAYVLPKKDVDVPSVADLQEHLLHSLPHYMIPAIFVQLVALPLSPNGKLDLKALPKPTAASLLRRQTARLPSNSIEDRLLGVVRGLLQNDSITSGDNFFLAGGHSLLGMQLIIRLRTTFGVEVTLRQLFEAPTVEHLALLIQKKLVQERIIAIWRDLLGVAQVDLDASFFDLGEGSASIDSLQRRIIAVLGQHVTKVELIQNPTVRQQAELLSDSASDGLALPPGVVALQPNGTGTAIFWLHYPCVNLAKALGTNQPFFYVTLTDEDLGLLGEAPTVQSIATCLLRKILAAQATGPYSLGGFCLGGILSYEIASQLRAAGHEVSLLTLLDTPSSSYYDGTQSLSFSLKNPRDLIKVFARLGLRKGYALLRERAERFLPAREERELVPPGKDQMQLMVEAAAARYQPQTYGGQVALIMASEHPAEVSFLPWWQSLISGTLHEHSVKAQHLELTEPPAVHIVAKTINFHLTRQRTNGEPWAVNPFEMQAGD